MKLDRTTHADPSTDPIARVPDLAGEHGCAWMSNDMAARKYLGMSEASLVCWFIEAAWAHPIWHSYALSLVHLRQLEGFPENLIYLDGATHEMALFALDPKTPREPQVEGRAKLAALSPINFAAQFIEISDELALDRIKRTIQMILNRELSPDTDFIRSWVRLFGDNMMRER